jgi:itaconyl-CoA hydratase
MTFGRRELGPQHYREDIGRCFEDFVVGDRYEHRPGRTITEADNTWFTLLTMNTHPLHFDANYAAKTEFGKPVVNSLLTLAIVTGQSVSDTSQKAIANLGWGAIRLTAPVFVGDTLYAQSEVLSLRLSRSRPGQGLVEIRTSGANQHGIEVIAFTRTFLVPLRGHAVEV